MIGLIAFPIYMVSLKVNCDKREKKKEESPGVMNFLLSVWSRYHVPRSWFKPSGNILVIFEEKGGDPTKISFSRRKISGVCAFVAEDYPSFELESWHENGNVNNENKATVLLKCPKNTRISTVKFASFGTPSGACGSYSKGYCHDPNSTYVVEKASIYFFCFHYTSLSMCKNLAVFSLCTFLSGDHLVQGKLMLLLF
jgi:hypothetical protein